MKRTFAIALICGLVVFGAATVYAITPTVMIFFDDVYYVEGTKHCPFGTPMTIPDSAYVVARDFNMYMVGIEFSITYPGQMFWTGDDAGDALVIGSTPTGIAVAWQLPQNAFEPFLVTKIKFLWNCNGCPITDIPVVVAPHPVSGHVQAVRWPDDVVVYGVGMTSLICATISAEETSWGRIKAIYEE